jgi:hypothetical protein
MSVYIDEAVYPFRNMVMCHMVADTLEELHEMADKIGVQRKWFQDKKIPHYDICKSKRVLAIRHGAVELTQGGMNSFMRHILEEKRRKQK